MSFPNAESFILVWEDIAFDLVILDIYMGGLSGLELAELIRKKDPDIMIIFATSYAQHAIEGYSVNASQYLLKPISSLNLTPILDKAFKKYNEAIRPDLLVQNGGALIKLKPQRIHHITIASHEAKIYTDSEIFTNKKTISELITILPHYFALCHRSHIVNMLKVECLLRNKLVLYDGTELPVSRGHAQEISDLFIKLGVI